MPRPYLTALIRGGVSVLDSAAQCALATWISKVAITARFAHLRPDHVESSWTNLIFNQKTALPGWHVWLGAYIGSEPIYYDAHDIRLTATDGRVLTGHGVLVSLVIGNMAIQLLGIDGGVPLEFPGSLMHKIWPLAGRPLAWPPPEGCFGDARLLEFVGRWLGKPTGLAPS